MNSVVPNSVHCVICGIDDFTVLYPPGVAQVNQIVQCNRCGLMYAQPRSQADCDKLEANVEQWDFAEQNLQRFEKEQIQVRDYAPTRSLLNQLHPTRGKLIEVGSSCGFQLAAFRNEGWDVLGIEPDRNAARHAREKLQISTVVSTLEGASVPADSAEAVIMFHVIEHVPDPVRTLTEIFRVLKPGGHLVLETPRYDTLMFKVFGRRERSISCDGHIYFFTTDSLRKCYTRAGFELIKLDNVGRSMTLDRFAYNVGVMSKRLAVQRGIASLSNSLALNRFTVSLNLRDMQRVCLRKPT